jgi:hypothetical protein
MIEQQLVSNATPLISTCMDDILHPGWTVYDRFWRMSSKQPKASSITQPTHLQYGVTVPLSVMLILLIKVDY